MTCPRNQADPAPSGGYRDRTGEPAPALYLIHRDAGDGPDTVYASWREEDSDDVLDKLRASEDASLGVTYLEDVAWPEDRAQVDELLGAVAL